jgi:hypothetical protein
VGQQQYQREQAVEPQFHKCPSIPSDSGHVLPVAHPNCKLIALPPHQTQGKNGILFR